MKEDQSNTDETTLKVDLSEATEAVKEGRFEYALNSLKIILKDHPDNIDSLYLAAVSTRYLKKFDDSKKYIEHLLFNAPDMGRAFQAVSYTHLTLPTTPYV